MKKIQIMMQIPHITRIILLSAFLLIGAQNATAQNTQFRIYNREALRPAPPTNLRIVSIDEVAVKPRVSYQDMLDELSSDNYKKREKAALKLYKERKKHSYSIDLLMLQDNSELVSQYISSAIVYIVNKRPGTSRSLQGYFKDIHATFNSSGDPCTRANCIALLSWATDDFNEIKKLIMSSLNEESRYEFTNAAIAVAYFSPKSIEVYRTLANQLGSEGYEKKVIAEAMVNIALKFRDSSEGYNANRLIDGNDLLKKADSQKFSREIDTIESIASLIRSRALGSKTSVTADSGIVFQVSKDFDWSLLESSTIKLNGKNVSITKMPDGIKFMGDGAELTDGLNIFDSLRVKYTVWLEDKVLRSFKNPYKKSYAVIVAIDQYKNTGYEKLGNMVKKAVELEKQLVKQGFPKEKIFHYMTTMLHHLLLQIF